MTKLNLIKDFIQQNIVIQSLVIHFYGIILATPKISNRKKRNSTNLHVEVDMNCLPRNLVKSGGVWRSLQAESTKSFSKTQNPTKIFRQKTNKSRGLQNDRIRSLEIINVKMSAVTSPSWSRHHQDPG